MNKIKLFFVILLTLSACEYEPMLKSYDFEFEEITSEGDKFINNILENNLKNRGKGLKKFDLNISTKKEREVVSSNDKGDATIFNLKIYVDYQVLKEGQIILKNSIIKEISYNNIDDKFKLNENENNILNYLSETILSEIFTSVVSVSE